MDTPRHPSPWETGESKVATPVPVTTAASDDGESISSNAPETELRQTLKERHVNMIGFSVVLGVGLFLSAGKCIFISGPGMAVIAYVLMGTLMWSVMASMGEMTALFPVRGPIFEFARRFIDESIGLSVGWMMWFSYVCVVAAELSAITEIFRFRVDPAYLRDVNYPEPTVEWAAGLGTNPSVWVGLFLIVILVVNLMPVRQYGRLEYIFGCIKLTFLVALIMINVVLSARQKFHSTRFWTYETPWGFATTNFTARAGTPNHPPVVYTGPTGQFAAFWTTMVTSFFSLMGWDLILLTAPENKHLQREETIKISTRKIALRVIVLYTLAVFAVGLNIPYTDDGLRNLTINGVWGGHSSAFVLAAIREHVVGLPHFLNGFFIFSAATTGINCLYGASRLLHAIASLRDAWPQWGWAESIRSRLETTRLGVPMNAVFVSWLFGFIAFSSSNAQSAETLGRIIATAATSTLIVYAVNCVAFLKFFREINSAACGERDEELDIQPEMRNRYRRSAKRYPYRSHLQWIRALYGLVFCILMIIFQGWRTLIPPATINDFVASYISVLLFIVLATLYFFKTRGFRVSNWHINATKLAGLEAVGPLVVVDPNSREPCKFCGMKHRRGVLVLPKENGFSKRKARAVLEWVWTWMK
ncbi:amino acid permease-domain-containing protein [Podospora aff. communis PSN243]|uniref:Amino acid permease-domain-containing protein n=1 Tax=Podospora aff. communis PSN243 TaxID=3040156 RepID=A0AAV9GAL4_9PEZI|nr:amino acid permease-domain-containing protein [Podospora aff. communis PSN243]